MVSYLGYKLSGILCGSCDNQPGTLNSLILSLSSGLYVGDVCGKELTCGSADHMLITWPGLYVGDVCGEELTCLFHVVFQWVS